MRFRCGHGAVRVIFTSTSSTTPLTCGLHEVSIDESAIIVEAFPPDEPRR
jgi:hypothetical protein